MWEYPSASPIKLWLIFSNKWHEINKWSIIQFIKQTQFSIVSFSFEKKLSSNKFEPDQ